jgi:hypothetical protein
MKVHEEIIFAGIRTQYIKWKKSMWSILSNERFIVGDFTIKICCDVCGPDVYVPKVISYKGNRLCVACLTRMIEMLNTATLDDCGKDRNDRSELQKRLEKSEK